MNTLTDEELDRLQATQWGCAGTHRGDGTPGCPQQPHHHHDDRCRPPLREFQAMLNEVRDLRARLKAAESREDTIAQTLKYTQQELRHARDRLNELEKERLQLIAVGEAPWEK